MNIRGSIARRLSITLGLSSLVLWLCAVGISGYVIRHELNETFNQTMRQSASRLLALAAHELEEAVEEGTLGSDDAQFIQGFNEQGANLDYYITGPTGHILVLSGDAPTTVTDMKMAPGFSTLNDAPAYALRDPETDIGIVVVERAGLRTGLLRESLLAMLMPLVALIPLLIALVYLVVRIAMRPIWELEKAVSQRNGRNLGPLNIGPQPRELAPVVQEVENLLNRLQAAMDAERSFAAESAHELRTPIAGALAQVQVLRNSLDGDPNQAFARSAEDALRKLSTLSENLLQSSRLEAGFALSSKAENLGPVIGLVLREHEFTSGVDRFDLKGEPDALVANIVPDAFAIVLRNLLRNALLYAHGDTTIHIAYGEGWLTIANDCAALDPKLLSTLTHRFVRGDLGKRGSGLGLSIVSGILENCGAHLTLASPILGQSRGFEAHITFDQFTSE